MVGKTVKIQRLNIETGKRVNRYDVFKITKLNKVDARNIKTYEAIDMETEEEVLISEIEIKKYGKVLDK